VSIPSVYLVWASGRLGVWAIWAAPGERSGPDEGISASSRVLSVAGGGNGSSMGHSFALDDCLLTRPGYVEAPVTTYLRPSLLWAKEATAYRAYPRFDTSSSRTSSYAKATRYHRATRRVENGALPAGHATQPLPYIWTWTWTWTWT